MRGLNTPLEIAWVVTFAAWFLVLMAGPLRVLLNGVQGNIAVVGYRHLPIAQRLRQWEAWMALPMIAYLLSILSGVGASLLTGTKPGFGLICLAAGMVVLLYLGLFWGMQDHANDYTLQGVTNPGVFLAEIRSRAVDGRLNGIDLEEVVLQRPKIRVSAEPEWQSRIRRTLSERYRLEPVPGPTRGAGLWRNSAGVRVRIRNRFVATMLVRQWWFWVAAVLTTAILLIGARLYLDQSPIGEHRTALRMIAFDVALALVTACASWAAARSTIIYSVRLRLAEEDQLAQVDELLRRSTTPDLSREGPLWRDLLLVAARHASRRKPT